ncbi:MAG: dephospho-CoA kinase [Phycisphaerales bacterium]
MNEKGASETGGERLILRTRPGVAFAALYRWSMLGPGAVAVAAYFLVRRAIAPDWARGFLWFALAWAGLYLAWGVLAWLSRCYELTDRRVVVRAGVLRRVMGDVPLRNIQHVTMTRSLAERLLGLGTIGVATAGSDGAAIHLRMIHQPELVVDRISGAARRTQGSARANALGGTGGSPAPSSPSHRLTVSPSHAVPVIGLAGGIGAGKSEVARVLARLGCAVEDSDALAREALNRPEVRARLREWWGDRVFGADGVVDRRSLAAIVFAEPAERARLEGLTHPIVRATRAERFRAAAGARALVIDAPLLFEAGSDAECDAVIFVDAPRDVRLARLTASRGWDDAELARREAAQWPVQRKRELSHEVVANDGSTADLEPGVRAALDRILSRHAAPKP